MIISHGPSIYEPPTTKNLTSSTVQNTTHKTRRHKNKNKNKNKQKMSKPRRPNPMLISYLSLLLIHTHFSICNGVSAFDLNSLKGSGIDGMVGAGRACNQKIGECLTEPEMESETSRRVLAMQKKYISYETLRRDLVPCGKPGASYYNCHAVAANPYSRGCEVITRCARGSFFCFQRQLFLSVG
ncbi:PREDICTED: protein RALF-like 24 isoform X1 [Prunus mume]|uniref:Protein RALF-like 24 isoform X1 n=1 Tax=Prunus mume TaxID=102107 RepID=A0ABM1LIX4_PRUMU|nr:PREDICTED: protein RALF-like 24 isoform X1 [Prunus mume]